MMHLQAVQCVGSVGKRRCAACNAAASYIELVSIQICVGVIRTER